MKQLPRNVKKEENCPKYTNILSVKTKTAKGLVFLFSLYLLSNVKIQYSFAMIFTVFTFTAYAT